MSYKNFAKRLSTFALISAIESDLREIILEQVGNLEPANILPQDVYSNAEGRLIGDRGISINGNDNLFLSDLLEYVDFYDLSKILNKIKNEQACFDTETLKFITSSLENLSPCRNRVCHSRPLENEDFQQVLDFATELKSFGKSNNWENINHAIKNLSDFEFVLTYTIPTFWQKDKEVIIHNIPVPEFDDTGFLGRKDDRKRVNELILSNTRVISIVGEGGIGKTALAQRCLYDILEISESESEGSRIFDMILWVSLKTNTLTHKGAESIKNAIKNSDDMFKSIHDSLIKSENLSLAEILNEILEYLSTFKILLCIDNLETISSNEVRDFLSQIPNNSKVLITTRIGLGEIEYRFKLDKLSDKDSTDLLRQIAKMLNVDSIIRKKTAALNEICRKLYNNPLLIKWFVFNEASGNNMSSSLDRNSQSFREALKFCFENLYDNLNEFEIKTISAIACIKKPITNVELKYYLDDLDEIELQQALNQLFNSSMLITMHNNNEKVYTLTSIAEEYISTLRPVDNSFYARIKEKQRDLRKVIESDLKQKNHYKYDLSNIVASTKDEVICSLYLKRAISNFKNGNIDETKKAIQSAKSLMPEYSEIYRINSYILSKENPFLAEHELETSIEYNPNNVLTRYAYAQFLVAHEDFPRADEQITAALKLDPDEKVLLTYKAWILTLNGNYTEAIKLYDFLINDTNNISEHRKFRISTFDQAINCYRRHTEVLITDRDFNQAVQQLKVCISIASKSFATDSFDKGIFDQLFKLTKLIYQVQDQRLRIQLNIELLDLIESYLSVFSNIDKINMLNSITEYQAFIDSETLNKLRLILESKRENLPLGNKLSGTIKTINKGQYNNVSYGFIAGEDDKDYFFKRSDLEIENCLDKFIDNDLSNDISIRVNFITDSAERGLIAKKITLLDTI